MVNIEQMISRMLPSNNFRVEVPAMRVNEKQALSHMVERLLVWAHLLTKEMSKLNHNLEMGKSNRVIEISVREEIKRQTLDNQMKVPKDDRIEQSILES